MILQEQTLKDIDRAFVALEKLEAIRQLPVHFTRDENDIVVGCIYTGDLLKILCEEDQNETNDL